MQLSKANKKGQAQAVSDQVSKPKVFSAQAVTFSEERKFLVIITARAKNIIMAIMSDVYSSVRNALFWSWCEQYAACSKSADSDQVSKPKVFSAQAMTFWEERKFLIIITAYHDAAHKNATFHVLE